MTDTAPPTSPPRRRFVPEPIETTRSSKRQQQAPSDSLPSPPGEEKGIHQHVAMPMFSEPSQSFAAPRRFLPQPVEESTRSSRKPRVQHIEEIQDLHPGKKADITQLAPEEPANDPPRRRFAPEPVETSTRISKKKFASEPVETSTRSSKDKKNDKSNEAPRRKFLPEAVETTSTRRRRKASEVKREDSDEEPQIQPLTPIRTSSSGRKFSPELIGTGRASYKRDKPSSVSSSSRAKHRQIPSPPASISSVEEESHEPPAGVAESRFSAAALAKRKHAQERQHSFHVPDLPMIESDSSNEESDLPSIDESEESFSSTNLDLRTIDEKNFRRGPTDRGTHAEYVLNLASRAVDQHVMDQAMAAYINERPHEPVNHFAVDDEEEDSHGHLSSLPGIDVRIFRRESAADLSWELKNMQKHHEQLERAKRDLKEHTAGTSRFSAAALAARDHGIGVTAEKLKKEQKKVQDPELKRMRNAASPPMLGDELVFPFSISPKMTRCDVDQIPRPRTNASHYETEVEDDPMLWTTHSNTSNTGGEGLWMGMCKKTENPEAVTRPQTPLRSGLQTPAFEQRNPFEPSTPGRHGHQTPGKRSARPFSGLNYLPLTPPRESLLGEDPFTLSIDRKLNREREIDAEFPSAIVTQIYNYLSLGYPVLAHPFDEELSKISRIPIEELRRDDENTDAKGHVDAPEGEGVAEEAVIGGKCKRWEALRLYCREWMRQSPRMAEKGPNDWGAYNRLRRGSWNR